MSIRRILEVLSSHDYRVTWQRWAVAAHIALKGDRLFTVDELYRSIKELYPDIGLTTVYRTLDLLVDLGVIDRVHGEDGQARYWVRRLDEASRQELVCERCGTVRELDVGSLQPFLRSLLEREDFAVHRYELKLYGECPQCRRQGGAERGRSPQAEGRSEG